MTDTMLMAAALAVSLLLGGCANDDPECNCDCGFDGGVDRGGDRSVDRGLDRTAADRATDQGPDLTLDRGVDRGVDRGKDQGPDLALDRGVDNGKDRGMDRDVREAGPTDRGAPCQWPNYSSDCSRVTKYMYGFSATCSGSTVSGSWRVHHRCPGSDGGIRFYYCKYTCPKGCKPSATGWPSNGADFVKLYCKP